MILALRIIATLAIIAGWLVFSSINRMGAMIAIKTSMRLTPQEKDLLVQLADRSYWKSLAVTGCIAAVLLAFVWGRALTRAFST